MFQIVFHFGLILLFLDGNKAEEPYNACSARFAYEYQILERLLKLEMEKSALAERLDVLESENAKAKSKDAFKMKLSNAASLKPGQKLIFDVPLVDIGGAYDVQSGIFKALVPGMYLFSVTACADNNDWLALYIMKNKDHMLGEIRAGDDSFKDCSSDTTVTHLDKGDSVWVERRGETSGSGKIDVQHMNLFTGVLIG